MYRAVDEKVNRMKSWLSERQRVKLSHLEHQKQNLQHKMDSLCETESTLKASLKELESVSFLEVRLITNIRKRRKWLTVSFPQVLRGCFRQYSSPNPNCYFSPKVKKNVVHWKYGLLPEVFYACVYITHNQYIFWIPITLTFLMKVLHLPSWCALTLKLLFHETSHRSASNIVLACANIVELDHLLYFGSLGISSGVLLFSPPTVVSPLTFLDGWRRTYQRAHGFPFQRRHIPWSLFSWKFGVTMCK